MERPAVPPDARYLMTPDGATYGPVDAITLCAWAAEARVSAECRVSPDGQNWQSAGDIPELRLNWQTRLADGTSVGPFNLFALWELIQDGSLPRGTPVTHRLTGETVLLDEHLFPLALRESRAMLDTMASRMAQSLAERLPEQDALRGRVAQAERDLADTLRLMGETQRLIVTRDQQIKALEERASRAETRAALAPPSSDPQAAAEHEALAGRLAAAERALIDEQARGAAALESLHEERERERAELSALKAASKSAQAAWQAEREALLGRCQALEERLRTREAAIPVLEERASALAAQCAAAGQAAEALKAEYERRVADLHREAEAAAERDARTRNALEQETRALATQHAELQAACGNLKTALAAAEASCTASREETASAAARLAESVREIEALRQRLAQSEALTAETAAGAAAARSSAETELADWRARCAGHEATIESLRRTAREAEAGWVAERNGLQQRLTALEQRSVETTQKLAEREAQQAEARKSAVEHQKRAARLERELEQTHRRLEETKTERARLQASLKELRERSADETGQLQGELKATRRDLQALTLLKTVTRVLREERAEDAHASIDWLSGAPPPAPVKAPVPEKDEAETGPGIAQQVDLLHQELKASIQDKEQLRRELDRARAEGAAAERRRDEKERELGARIAQLESAQQPGGGVPPRALEELEKRASAWRIERKKAEETERALLERIAALEAELARKAEEPPVVIEGEWHPPLKAEAPPRPDAPPPPQSESARGRPQMLNSVEAQLQAELEKWHSLSQDKDRKAEKPRAWFRWKQT